MMPVIVRGARPAGAGLFEGGGEGGGDATMVVPSEYLAVVIVNK
jgi:hypothetical protein